MKLIWDINQFKVTINQVSIYIAPEKYPPFPVIARVEEQDTSLVLEPDDELRDPGDGKPVWYDSNKADLLETHQPGDVLVKGVNPMQLLTIVHDLDHTPSWKSEWIETAMDQVFKLTHTKSLSTIGIPVLGAQFGRFSLEEFISIFVETLNKYKFNYALKIWFIVKTDECQRAFELLKTFESD